jgi:hypothetical protein
MAGGAYPDAPRGQNLLAPSVLDLTDNLVGNDIHRGDDGTSRRTLLALVAGPNVHIALFDDFLKK